MTQQKGMKRAAKVVMRKRKLTAKAKLANIRRTERQVELAEKEGLGRRLPV